MRRYDEQVEVRRGLVAGVEGPQQILWRGRLFCVRDVLDHWLETGPWWRSAATRAVHGIDVHSDGAAADHGDAGALGPARSVLLEAAEREVWRVEVSAGRESPTAVLDVAMDWADGRWRLVHAHD